jgi:prepilin-type N-terminal cleavage/methylation domain-containing protein/prepilin-type processing-associated H-X9-DG protein
MKPKSSRFRPGFTLVELLVVIAIIGVLVALLLPAVQAAREAARRMQCQNNLKQIGLAIHNFHDSKKILPPAQRQSWSLTTNATVAGHSWATFILPYIEQQALHDKYDFGPNISWGDPPNDAGTGPTRNKIATYLCPSAPTNRPPNPANINNPQRGMLDYPATTERTWPDPPATGNIWVSAQLYPFVRPGDPQFMGAMGQDDWGQPASATTFRPCNRSFASIVDGTSNTMLVAECAGKNGWWLMGKKQPTEETAGPWANPNNRLNIGGFNPANPTDTVGPCVVNCANDKEIYAFHPGTANTVLADGSVRGLSTTVSLDTVLKLLTRARGEVNDPLN